MERPIFPELIRRGQLPYDWVQGGHAGYVWARSHFWFLTWLILMAVISGLMIGVCTYAWGWY